MPINQVLLSNTFNEFRTTVNEITDVVNDLTANVLSGEITANTITVGQVSSNLIPSANITYDLGSSTNRWKDVYLSGNTIYLGDAEIKYENGEIKFTAEGNAIPVANIDASNITSGTLSADRLATSGVSANTYGSSSKVPVLVIDDKGRITSAANVNVAGVTEFDYYSGNSNFVIYTADGGSFSTTIGQDLSTGANVTFNKVTVSTIPTTNSELANKAYVDEVAEGLRTKPAVEIATTDNLTATYDNGTLGVGATLTANTNGAFLEIDGITLSSTTPGENGVLVKNQSDAAQNGRYNLTTVGNGSNPWVLTRCGLCDEATEIPGAYVFVKRGTLYAGTGWVQIVADPTTFTVGTDAITVTQFSGVGSFTAGTGLELNGTEFRLANTTVTAGTLGSANAVSQLIVDAQGRITSAANVNIAIDGSAITSGTLSADRLATSGVAEGGYGSANQIPVLVIDNKGRVTSAANVAVSGGISYTYRTSNYTASNKDGVLANTAGGSFTVTLPASPSTGAEVIVADAGGSWGTNNLTVARNGATIEGQSENLICDISDVSIQFVYDGTTWQIYTQLGGERDGQILFNKTLQTYAVKGTAIGNTGATRTIDLDDGNFFSATLDQSCVFTFSDPPSSGDFGTFVLELTNGGAYSITWPGAVDWPGGVAPTLTASGVDQLVFTTRDAGTTWFGFVAGLDIRSP